MLQNIDNLFMSFSFTLNPIISFHVLHIVIFLLFMLFIEKNWSDDFSFFLLIVCICLTVYIPIIILREGHLFITAFIVAVYPYVLFYLIYTYINWYKKRRGK